MNMPLRGRALIARARGRRRWMSNTDVPAASAGGGPEAPPDRLPEDLPAKIRVHALAKLLGVTSKDVLAALSDIGSQVPSASSTVVRAVALRVAETLLPEPAEPAEADPDELGDAALSTPLVPVFAAPQPLFMPPQPVAAPAKPVRGGASDDADDEAYDEAEQDTDVDDAIAADDGDDADEPDEAVMSSTSSASAPAASASSVLEASEADEPDDDQTEDDQTEDDDEAAEADADDAGTRRRRRRRRRKGASEEEAPQEDDP